MDMENLIGLLTVSAIEASITFAMIIIAGAALARMATYAQQGETSKDSSNKSAFLH